MSRKQGLRVLFAVMVVIFMVAMVPQAFASLDICVNINKHCVPPPDAYSPVQFFGWVRNCGSLDLDVYVTDLVTGDILINGLLMHPGDTAYYEGEFYPAECGMVTNEVMAKGVYAYWSEPLQQYFYHYTYDNASVTCEVPCDGGGMEGCTPGFWKNNLDAWPAPYTPGDSFFGIFGIDLGYATLGDAINAKGGGSGKLARHGTAALLNAATPDDLVDYPLTVMEVIQAVQSGDVDPLVEYNEYTSDGFCN